MFDSDNQNFTYRPGSLNDSVTFFTEQLKSGIKFKKVVLVLSIYIVPPIVIEHAH